MVTIPLPPTLGTSEISIRDSGELFSPIAQEIERSPAKAEDEGAIPSRTTHCAKAEVAGSSHKALS